MVDRVKTKDSDLCQKCGGWGTLTVEKDGEQVQEDCADCGGTGWPKEAAQ